MTRWIPLTALLVGAGCGSPEQGPAPAAKKASAPAERIRDQTHLYRKEGLLEAKVVDNNLGGKDFMPGGNFAEYEKDGKKYQVLFTLRRNADQAMFLFMDYSGFYGMDGETPTLVFPKQKYLVVVTGLELEDADQAARTIAGYLN